MQEGFGFILECKEYSNSSLIIKIFTPDGKITGFLKGGIKQKSMLQLFTYVKFKLTKRLQEHLGAFKIEVIDCIGLLLLKNRIKFNFLLAIAEALTFLLQEESPEEDLYIKTSNFLYFLQEVDDELEMLSYYLKYELEVLSILGFGLDFNECALGGSTDDLCYISPITGRCASFSKAQFIKEKLFTIPKIYGNKLDLENNIILDLQNAFKINSHFMQNILGYEKLTKRRQIISKIQPKI